MIELKLPDMSCGHCVSTVTETVKLLDPAARVEVDLATKLVKVESGETRDSIEQALADAGYPPAR
ncbi:MAG: heavy-metal-associated domain-containing protein [Ramlibacter sp.]|nr:heavy-metal-associated domain-containing protein [Ramlibacter sp.]